MASVKMNTKAVDVLLKELRVDVAYLRSTEDDAARFSILKSLREIDFLERVVLNGYNAETSNELYVPIARKIRPIENSIILSEAL